MVISYKYWTKEEEKFLEEKYLVMGNKEIGKMLSRSSRSVSDKLIALKLKRPKELIHTFLSQESKDKIGKANKGRIPWNKSLTKETDERVKQYGETLSKKKKGISYEEQFGEERAKEIKKNKSESMMGKKNFNYGKTWSESTRKKQIESHIGKSKGEKNPMYGKRGVDSPRWIDGRSFKGYNISFNESLKIKIKERDNFTCQMCGKKLKKDLHIHHINHTMLDDREDNLITLCNSCHGKTKNKKKYNYWIKFFQNNIHNKNFKGGKNYETF